MRSRLLAIAMASFLIPAPEQAEAKEIGAAARCEAFLETIRSIDQLQFRLARVSEDQRAAEQRLQNSFAEIERQRHDRYLPGCGPRCKAAIIDADKAGAELARTTIESECLRARLGEARGAHGEEPIP